jgi:hypothetical protein
MAVTARRHAQRLIFPSRAAKEPRLARTRRNAAAGRWRRRIPAKASNPDRQSTWKPH